MYVTNPRDEKELRKSLEPEFTQIKQEIEPLMTRDLMKRLHMYFECMVDVPRVRIGKRQTIETLICEEALLFARFLRSELKAWAPRIVIP